MAQLPEKEQSFWKARSSKTTYLPISQDIATDAVIVGGGITGLTAAYLLKQSGRTVAVLEKNSLGSGTTGGTTGKVTAQHHLIYADLKKQFGTKVARVYAEANQAAVERIGELIKTEGIACGWQRQDSYVFTTDARQTAKLKTEARVAKSLGLPASFETRSDLPFAIQAAVKFGNQAQFNAREYVMGLARLVHGNGSFVFENSNVIRLRDGHDHVVIKTKDASVTAKDAIIASKVPPFPLLARFNYAALEYPHTSYIVAGEYEGRLGGMYISPDENHYSILPVKSGSKQLLLVGGENHIPGLGSPDNRYQKLADYAQKHFGVSTITYKWRAMDYIAYDNLPLIGKLYPWSKHFYVATGFKKWGLSTSMVAATILRDTILGQPNPWADVFTSSRLRPVLYIPKVVFK